MSHFENLQAAMHFAELCCVRPLWGAWRHTHSCEVGSSYGGCPFLDLHLPQFLVDEDDIPEQKPIYLQGETVF
jgi:hypothetical protein